MHQLSNPTEEIMTWLDRALLLYERIEKSNAPDEIKALSWDAKQCFVEAKDMRKCASYETRRLESGRMHRKGVKLFSAVMAFDADQSKDQYQKVR
jgi:hypothetical protein